MLPTYVNNFGLKEQANIARRPEVVGRYAPSPSGRMHLGNIFSFLISYLYVKQNDGYMVLRIEDLDPARSKQEYIDQIFRDLEWFGFDWEGEVLYQSRRSEIYAEAFELLSRLQKVYPCFCTRADLHSAQAPHEGDEIIYPGTCKYLTKSEIEKKQGNPAYRISVPNTVISFEDLFQGFYTQNLMDNCGDFVIKRKDGTSAYQLAVVIDDAEQHVSVVIRGLDLLSSSPRQIFLQDILSLKTPHYGHVPLLVDSQSRKLSKRNRNISLQALQDKGLTSSEVLGSLAFHAGIISEYNPCSLSSLVSFANLDSIKYKKTLLATEK